MTRRLLAALLTVLALAGCEGGDTLDPAATDDETDVDAGLGY